MKQLENAWLPFLDMVATDQYFSFLKRNYPELFWLLKILFFISIPFGIMVLGISYEIGIFEVFWTMIKLFFKVLIIMPFDILFG